MPHQGAFNPQGFPLQHAMVSMNIFMFPPSKGGEDMVCPALGQCSDMNIFRALLYTSYVLVWGNPVEWLLSRALYTWAPPQHWWVKKSKSCTARNKTWKKQESVPGMKEPLQWLTWTDFRYCILPGPVRWIASLSIFLLILAINTADLTCHVHPSKLLAKTEEISKSIENAGHFFLL